MRTRNSMGKMVNKLTKREKNDSFMLIDRIARGVSHPYTKTFLPTLVASQRLPDDRAETYPVRENEFYVAEHSNENVIVMRSNFQQPTKKTKIVFPEVFYEYFEVVENKPQKAG